MKKIVATIAASVILAGMSLSSVSAEEYEVEKGDSLWRIAKDYQTTVDNLVEINNLKTTVIQPKQILFINETYIVEKGDTLSDIGKEFDVTVKDLKSWNNLESNLIVIDQELEIKGVNVDQEEAEKEKKTAAPTEELANTQETSTKEKNESPAGKTITVSATAYTADCAGCSGITSTGINLNTNPNAKVIAVDPNVIPLGTEVYVEGYGYATAADTGGAINGNKIDIHVPSKSDAYGWGVRTVNVTILR